MHENILRALDLCTLKDWEGARRSLEGLSDPASCSLATLIKRQQQARHELGNALSIAQVILEAMLDGVLEVTPERLRALLDSLHAAGNVARTL